VLRLPKEPKGHSPPLPPKWEDPRLRRRNPRKRKRRPRRSQVTPAEKARRQPVPTSSVDEPLRRKRESPTKLENVWTWSKRVWNLSKPYIGQNLCIPEWYSGYVGVPNWYLRQRISHKKMTDQRCKLAMYVRMNYILDTGHGLSDRARYVRNAQRLYPLWLESHPLYEGGSYMITCKSGCDYSFATKSKFDLDRALACTVRNFVHLYHPPMGESV